MAGSDASLRLLGLAARAGAVVPGTERVREAVRSGTVYLVIVAADASENSRDKLDFLVGARDVPCMVGYDRLTLGEAVGRAPLSAVGVTDRRLAERLQVLGKG